jgi:glycine hydroxymethyltransferase
MEMIMSVGSIHSTRLRSLRQTDPDIAQALGDERDRQINNLELIASENFVSNAVLEAMGSVATNKYAEGYPGRRYYGGCEVIDRIETLAIERAKTLFGAEHSNVQPHSGSQANMAVYMAFLKPGDTLMGMDLSMGGHLTHGSPVNFSGKLYNIVSYGVRKEDERIDYEAVRDLARRHRPRMIVAGGSAYPRQIDFGIFKEAAEEVGAFLMVDMAHFAGLVAAGEHPSPVPVADFVTSTVHKTLRGPRGGFILCKQEHARKIDSSVFPGIQGGPLEHIIAAKAVAFKEAAEPSFKEYARRVKANAAALAAGLAKGGLRVVSGGTDTHLVLVDLSPKGITGRDAEDLLGEAAITVNKNAIPFDSESPAVTSGIRVGSAALTTRGMGEAEMAEIADIIVGVIASKGSEAILQRSHARALEIAARFPLFAG